MKGDFSRSTFDPKKHYSSVRMQQGRVQLDADWNEQADILGHLLTSLAKDIFGEAGGIADAFKISVESRPAEESEAASESDSQPRPALTIHAGHYYVDGILCENEGEPGALINFLAQPDLPLAAAEAEVAKLEGGQAAVVYLDVWPRHITMHEDPALQEIALGGIDTTTRTKTIWQARLLPVEHDLTDPDLVKSQWHEFKTLQKPRGRLQARHTGNILENQLYRVEVHGVHNESVILKWAPDNASTAVPIAPDKIRQNAAGEGGTETWTFGVDNLPLSIGVGDCLELVDDSSSLTGRTWPLAEVISVDRQAREITIMFDTSYQTTPASLADLDMSQHYVLRRWEKELVVQPETDPGSDRNWTDLNGSVKVRLVAPDGGNNNAFRPGDYWWIPVRADPAPNGTIAWPAADNGGLLPHGIEHHYAPLALIHSVSESGWQVEDWRPEFIPIVDFASRLQSFQENVDRRLEEFNSRLEAALERAVSRDSLGHIFRSTDVLEEGQVVALAVAREAEVEERAEQLIALASSDAPTLILGVVSHAPPFHTMETRYTVTVYGRASCLVTGRVDPGDLLVPSSQPGYARRAGLYIRPGTVIGKALSSHDPNPEAPDLNGKVNILVMLG